MRFFLETAFVSKGGGCLSNGRLLGVYGFLAAAWVPRIFTAIVRRPEEAVCRRAALAERCSERRGREVSKWAALAFGEKFVSKAGSRLR